MRRFGEITSENREVERNLTYINQRRSEINDKKVPTNSELRAAVTNYFRRLAEANEEEAIAK